MQRERAERFGAESGNDPQPSIDRQHDRCRQEAQLQPDDAPYGMRRVEPVPYVRDEPVSQPQPGHDLDGERWDPDSLESKLEAGDDRRVTLAQRSRYCPAVACAAIGAGADGVILRVWAGRPGERPRVPATLKWSEAVVLAERLRAIADAIRG